MNATHVLLVEDDEDIREITAMALERYGFEVETAPDGLAGSVAFGAGDPDVVLLDVMMPFVDGLTLARKIRETSQVPIIMLTAKSDGSDVVAGLEAGADDYVTKPFDTQVLVARIRAVMRRSQPVPDEAHDIFTLGDLTIDRDALVVTRAGEPLSLTPTEMRLLLELADNPRVVVSREHLLETVWDYPADGDTRVVDVHVQRLRAKIGRSHIETVRGFGYKLLP